MKPIFADRVGFITGAGMGKATPGAFAQKGANDDITDISDTKETCTEVEAASIHGCPFVRCNRIKEINLRGVWLCMKYELIYMLTKGHWCNVNSSSTAKKANLLLPGRNPPEKQGCREQLQELPYGFVPMLPHLLPAKQ